MGLAARSSEGERSLRTKNCPERLRVGTLEGRLERVPTWAAALQQQATRTQAAEMTPKNLLMNSTGLEAQVRWKWILAWETVLPLHWNLSHWLLRTCNQSSDSR
jgi:hypothetical protein